MRSFLAIQPDKKARAELLHLRTSITAHEGLAGISPDSLRWQNDAQLHLTLHFLGNLSEAQQADVYRLAEEAARGLQSFRIQLQDIEWFPDIHKPFCLAAIPRLSQELETLHERLKRSLQTADIPTDQRRFRPHITLARTGGHLASAPAISRSLAEQGRIGWHATEFALFGSRLTDNGSEYTIARRFPLTSPTDSQDLLLQKNLLMRSDETDSND